jgi:hypothetical protein
VALHQVMGSPGVPGSGAKYRVPAIGRGVIPRRGRSAATT